MLVDPVQRFFKGERASGHNCSGLGRGVRLSLQSPEPDAPPHAETNNAAANDAAAAVPEPVVAQLRELGAFGLQVRGRLCEEGMGSSGPGVVEAAAVSPDGASGPPLPTLSFRRCPRSTAAWA